ncbi:MAG: phage integrase SAM-like domain-containing protein [Elusimicrobia bacterium]|nr:phage integrase SAM-like domain-containing protein [Elusimicrobiota bacterium]
MARSVHPSVWPEKHVAKNGQVTWRIRAEINGRRLPDLESGIPKKELAVKECSRIRTELWAGKLDAVLPKGRHTVGDLCDRYLTEPRPDKKASSRDLDRYALRRLKKHFGEDALLDSLTPESMRDFEGKMQRQEGKDRRAAKEKKPLSDTSRGMYMFAIRAAVNRAREVYKWIRTDPFDEVQIPVSDSKGRLVHLDEFEKIRPWAQAVVRKGYSLWDVLDVARHQGLRSGAVCALDGRMVERKTKYLSLVQPRRLGINRDAALKDTVLYAPIHPAVWPLFARAPESGRIFAGWTRNGVSTELRKILTRLGIPRFRPHDMKHTFATTFLQQGGDIADLSDITGTSERTLKKVYSHLVRRVPVAEISRVDYRKAASGESPSPDSPPKSETASPSVRSRRRRSSS